MTNAPKFRSEFLQTVTARGAYYAATTPEALDELYCQKTPVPAYIGFDCTAKSLHVGSLVQIMTLRRLQQAGHKPIVLMGGGTTRIGDPSGKDEARKLLTAEAIEENKQGIFKVFANFLKFGDGPTDAVMVDNADWLCSIQYIDFLRDVGRHFSVNQMLTRESVKLRLERDQPLSFLEFNYMILQAYDFVELYKRMGCRLQCGGSDQWGNIVSGTDLGRRLAGAELYGLTSPLLTTASGAKMGKSAAGAVWMNEDMLPSYDYWQFWRNTEDADVGRFLRLFTELAEDEIVRLESLQGAELNDAKKILATEATALAHGRDKAETAAETARKTFEQGALSENLPTVEIPAAELDGMPVAALAQKAGLTTSTSEARRLIQGGGLRINDKAISDVKAQISLGNDLSDGVIKLSSGKKKHILVKPQ